MSIGAAIFSDSQSRVYHWLFGQPERVYHLSELRRLTGLGSASLQREINRLVDAGLVREQRVGNLRQFQAQADSPVFTELVALTRKTLGVVPLLQQALAPLQPALRAASSWTRTVPPSPALTPNCRIRCGMPPPKAGTACWVRPCPRRVRPACLCR